MHFEPVAFEPIGILHSSHFQQAGTPVQPCFAEGCSGVVELRPGLAEGLQDLEGFERIWLIYVLDRAEFRDLKVVPYLDTRGHGIFATRSPARPNPIGLSCVRVTRIQGHRIEIEEVDILNGTPILDIKPYVPAFDAHPAVASGWMSQVEMRAPRKVADGRFQLSPR